MTREEFHETLRAYLDAWELPPGEPFKDRAYLAEGWVYRDISWVRHDFWKQLLDIFGENQYKFLAVSQQVFKDDNELYFRGQVLLSPEAIENCKNHNKDKDNG